MLVGVCGGVGLWAYMIAAVIIPQQLQYIEGEKVCSSRKPFRKPSGGEVISLFGEPVTIFATGKGNPGGVNSFGTVFSCH